MTTQTVQQTSPTRFFPAGPGDAVEADDDWPKSELQVRQLADLHYYAKPHLLRLGEVLLRVSGRPFTLDRAATALDAIGGPVGEMRTQVKEVGDRTGQWEGKAADKFRGELDKGRTWLEAQPQRVSDLGNAARETAKALREARVDLTERVIRPFIDAATTEEQRIRRSTPTGTGFATMDAAIRAAVQAQADIAFRGAKSVEDKLVGDLGRLVEPLRAAVHTKASWPGWSQGSWSTLVQLKLPRYPVGIVARYTQGADGRYGLTLGAGYNEGGRYGGLLVRTGNRMLPPLGPESDMSIGVMYGDGGTLSGRYTGGFDVGADLSLTKLADGKYGDAFSVWGQAYVNRKLVTLGDGLFTIQQGIVGTASWAPFSGNAPSLGGPYVYSDVVVGDPGWRYAMGYVSFSGGSGNWLPSWVTDPVEYVATSRPAQLISGSATALYGTTSAVFNEGVINLSQYFGTHPGSVPILGSDTGSPGPTELWLTDREMDARIYQRNNWRAAGWGWDQIVKSVTW